MFCIVIGNWSFVIYLYCIKVSVTPPPHCKPLIAALCKYPCSIYTQRKCFKKIIGKFIYRARFQKFFILFGVLNNFTWCIGKKRIALNQMESVRNISISLQCGAGRSNDVYDCVGPATDHRLAPSLTLSRSQLPQIISFPCITKIFSNIFIKK